MTSIVYGIVDARRVAEGSLPAGLEGAELFAVTHGSLAALLSPLVEAPAGAERALDFADVVGRLHDRMTILPMRFGCFVRHPEAAAEFLRRYEREFSGALDALEGCDEMGLRILVPGGSRVDERSEARTGKAYLADRRRFYEEKDRAERIGRAWAERAEAAFAGRFRHSSREQVERAEGTLLSLSFLVERSRVREFLEACRKFRREHAGEIAAACTGPFPPYVFVAGLIKSEAAARAERDLFERLKG